MEKSIEGSNMKHIVLEAPTFLQVYNDGTIEYLANMPRVPPSLTDSVSSKDILFSINPLLFARLYLPNNNNNNDQKLPILIYFHGSAFCCESAFAEHHHAYCNLISSQANVMILSVEYRKAPHHYLPAAYHDGWAALQWVASHANATQNSHVINEPWLTNHGDFSKIFIGGDSSGGNIVHSLAMRAGVESLPDGLKLSGAYMNHPYFHGSKAVEPEQNEGLEQSFLNMAWGVVYPPDGIESPMMNPLAPGAPSLATLGCSRIFISVAGDDRVLRDRAVLYYEALRGSGWKGQVELFEEKGEKHVYHMLHLHTPNAKKLIKHLTDFLRQ